MKIETLRERIENAETRIEKKHNTIEKKTKLIEKKSEQLRKMGFNPSDKATTMRDNRDAMWIKFDIENLTEDIERNKEEITEITEKLDNYRKQLEGEIEREDRFLKDIPETLKKMQSELVERWDRFDIERREQIKTDRREMEYSDYRKKYSVNDRHYFIYKTDEQIHKQNMEDAKCLIINLVYRVRNITGEITDWSEIYATEGNLGPVLNGYVVGKEGRAEVESILAGGYNIQKLHVRVLVKEIK